jgi:hypothetical protein
VAYTFGLYSAGPGLKYSNNNNHIGGGGGGGDYNFAVKGCL